MKKQTSKTKSMKPKQTKMAVAIDRAVVSHNRRQRFWGVVALAGLFLCGLFVGMNIGGKHVDCISDANAAPYVATDSAPTITEPDVQSVCGEVERLLLQRLPAADDDADDRIDRAKIYANLAERGCPENSETYVELARAELEIARAIENDDFDHEETIEVVETYKRLNMQAAAEEIFEKAKKLTDPAIDFILQVEKIINE